MPQLERVASEKNWIVQLLRWRPLPLAAREGEGEGEGEDGYWVLDCHVPYIRHNMDSLWWKFLQSKLLSENNNGH